MRATSLLIATGCIASLLLPLSAGANHYPLREVYKDIGIIQLADLARDFSMYTLIDVRTPLEYEVMHIKGAHNIEYPSTKFGKEIKALFNQEKKPMVFYAGGAQCMEPYLATQTAHEVFGINRTYTFDGGIIEWLPAQAPMTMVDGRLPADPASIITDANYRDHMLAPMEFERKIATDATLLDVRTYHEREGVGLFFGHEQWVPMDRYTKLLQVLKTAKQDGKALLIFDDHGHRTRMLQYTLRKLEIKDFYFMEGGAKAYYRMIAEMHDRDYDHGQVVSGAVPAGQDQHTGHAAHSHDMHSMH